MCIMETRYLLWEYANKIWLKKTVETHSLYFTTRIHTCI